MRAAAKMHKVCNMFHFYHHHWTQANNYGIVQIKHHSPQVNKTSSSFSVKFSLKITAKSIQEEREVEVAVILSSEFRTFTSHLNLPSLSPIVSYIVSQEHGDLAHGVCTFSMQL
jgi:nitrate reductase beta subunit